MNFAVTAAGGRLGAAVVRALLRRPEMPGVVGLARRPSAVPDLGIEIRPGDYADAEQLAASLAGVDTLLLVSLNSEPGERIELHRNVIHAARSAGVSRLVYTSVQGTEAPNASPVVASNRHTEQDVIVSGLDWVIGRNGIYIEPDVEFIDAYRAAGEIVNCAGEGKCGYTTREELADAYANLLLAPGHAGKTYNLHGPLITQAELAGYLNRAFGTQLVYRDMSVDDYRAERTAALGELFGPIIASIYEGIRNGALDVASDFAVAAGRPHQCWEHYFDSL